MKELRVANLNIEQREAGSSSLVLVGTPIVFDTPTVINDPAGSYTEIIERRALDGADLSDVRLLVNHDSNRIPLARTPKTMTLTVTPNGLQMRAELADTSEAKSVYEAIKRGDLSGMSFCFTVGDDSFDIGTKTRIIHKINKLYECSVVNFPAYPQTSVEARSKLDYYAQRAALIKQTKLLANNILRLRTYYI